jgi:hypothetical protein
MSRVKRCVTDALNIIRDANVLDEDMRREIAASLQRYLNRDDMPDEQALQKLQFALRNARRDVYVAQVSRQFSEAKQVELAQRFGAMPEDQRAIAVRNYIEEDAIVRERQGASIAAKARALQNNYVGRLSELWDNLFNVFGNDSAMARTFHRELLGVDTGDAVAARMAKSYRSATTELLTRLRQAGVYVGNIEDYAPRSHSVSKIQSKREEWETFLRRHLDPEEHPDPDAAAARIYDSLLHKDLVDTQGATISMHREIKFNSPEAEFEYMMRFGEDGYANQVMHNVMTLAQRVAVVEGLGPQPNRVGSQLLQEGALAARTARDVARREGRPSGARSRPAQAERAAQYGKNSLDAITGDLASPANQNVANWGAAGRNWMGFQFLGRVGLLAASQDSVISMFRARFHTGGFARGVAQNLSNMVEVYGSRAAREYATELGLFTNAFHAAASGRFSSAFAQGENLRMTSAKLALGTQRLSLSLAAERSLRSAFGLTVSRNLAKNLGASWGDLHPKYRRLLGNSGFTEGSWNEFRAGARVNELGAIDFQGMPAGLRETALSFLWREVDGGVIHPGNFDRAILTAGQQAGTISGEAIAIGTQFWSWPIAFFRKAVMFEWQMGKAGFTGFAAGMMMSGALATQLYALSAGEPTFEWDSPELWMRTAMRTGLFTPAGDLVMQAARGHSPSFGPIGATAESLITTVTSGGRRAIDGEMDRAAAPAVRLLRDLTIPNYFWSDAAVVNRTMDYIMWELDPQYMRNRERRWINEGRNL